MSDNNSEHSCCSDENDITIAPEGAALEELREQIRSLQKSLESSEKERMQLKDVISRQTITSVIAADVHREDFSTSFKRAEAISANFRPTTIVPVNDNAAVTSANLHCTSNHRYVLNSGNFATNSAISASENAANAVSSAGVNFANSACVSADAAVANRAGITQPNASFANTCHSLNVTAANWNATTTSAVYSASTPHFHSQNIPTAHAISHTQPPWSPGIYPPARKILDLPEFHGSPEEWPMFSVSYKETTIMYSYSNLENLLRLQKALKGKARQQVESLLIHPSSVDAVMQTLEFHYGRPEVLIRSQIAKARAFPAVSGGRISDILNFSAMVSNLAAFLENSGAIPHLNNPILLDELLCKLPMHKREEWSRHIFTLQQPYPTVRDFCNWLQQTAMYVSMATDVMPARQMTSNEQISARIKASSKPVMMVANDEKKCLMCEQNHQLQQCQKFRDADNSSRWSIVKSNRLCFGCMKSGHGMQNCRQRRVCGLSSCNKFHHRLLHNSKESEKGNTVAAGKAVATVSACQTVQQSSSCESNWSSQKQTLLKYLPVKLIGPKGEINVIAFIDEGAKVSLVEEKVANAIGLKGKTDLLRLKWIGNHTMSEQSRQVSLEIAGAFENASTHQMRGVRTTKKLYLSKQTFNLSEFQQHHNDMKNICVSDYCNAVPQILIGLPHSNLIRTIKAVNFDDGFAVHKTKLGWTFFGSNEECSSDGTIGHVDVEMTNWLEINKQITDYFAAENFEVKQLPIVRSEDDIRAENLLQKTTTFVNGRYETGLLWRSDLIDFPESYSMAMKRLEQIESKMDRDADYAEWYKAKINEHVEKGYAKRLSPAETIVTNNRTWYLPHFVTCNPNKGNKRRLVFDAAAKINEMSLNGALMKGPEEYQPKSLLSILFKFRQGRVGVCGDIREMFHRILIRQEDQNAQRFLWRGGDRSKPPAIYVMCAMIFGSISSPCSAQFVKNLHAEKFRNSCPRAVNAIVDRHYVDDYMDSFDSIKESIDVTKKVIDIHRRAGFELRGIVSNSKELMQSVVYEAQPCMQQPHSTCPGECATEKVLGMHWKPNEDYFFFKLIFSKVPKSVLDGTRRPSKGEMLSVMMSIFDPLGFLGGVLLCAKVLMQSLWRRNVDWHEAIPDDIYEKWSQWFTNLKSIEDFRMPRCYNIEFFNVNADVQLHIFVDASELAFSAVAYWRICYKDITEVIFIAGRSRCSPLKPMSIPRLELQSAVLGVRLKEAVVHNHDVKPSKITFWSDSKTVIQWIKSDARCYKQFVAHRIAEVLETSEISQWRWVPGKDNPADEATRIKPFYKEGKWLNGPPFLKLNEHDWPAMPRDFNEKSSQNEMRSKQLYTVHTRAEDTVIPFNKYSNFYKFIKVMTWVRLAIAKLRQPTLVMPNLLTALDMKKTELMICRLVQEDEFTEEIKSLGNEVPVSKSSPIFKLSPMLDEEGVLRLGGRTDYADCIPISTKRPIILPKCHAISRLIIRHYHELFYHQNLESVVCAIRHKFWIPNVRQLLRTIKGECQLCKNLAAVPEAPLMGQLPVDRLTPFVRPFSYTGIDYFGPVLVAIGRRQEKRWVALFTCLTTRAIHLELARDLSTDAAIIVCRNFINRRGVPIRLRSDRGTNFIGASKEEWVQAERGLESECSRRGVEWVFNTPANPSAGGIWERMVRTVKRVLMFTLKERAPQIETLQSLLIEAENLVNSRPLTHVPIESADAEPITPNHFLLGCPNYVQTPSVEEKTCLRKQWRMSQQLKQTFWKRWILEYLPTLTRRTKWHKRVKPISVGDVVIICDDNESRGQWKRGIILEANPAADGQVRSVLVKTATGNLRRPASKIAVLDVVGDSLEPESNHGGENVTAQT